MSTFNKVVRRTRCLGPSQLVQLRHVVQYSVPATRPIPEDKTRFVPTEGSYPKGFLVGTAHAQVKTSNTKYDDVTMIVSENLCSGAAVFTRNAFKAAPIQISKEALRSSQAHGGLRGVIINAGCANAITGIDGIEHARAMAARTSQCFNETSLTKQEPNTLVMSTGVIGQKLPIERILNAIPKAHAVLGNTHDHWFRAAQAICTTDTFPKLVSRSFSLPSDPNTVYSIAGITKGAGMIHPNLATLLGVICTDVNVESDTLHFMLKTAIGQSFNSITIDGDTSTNDTVAIFANGAASPSGSQTIQSHSSSAADRAAFQEVLNNLASDLAQLVVRDGEGATKFVTINVESVHSTELSHRVAMSIARSPLVKTAMYGKDANWGRILCAIGYSPDALASNDSKDQSSIASGPDSQISLSSTSVSFVPTDGSPELKLLTRGEPENVDEVRAKEILEMENLEIRVQLADNATDAEKHVARVWTCDYSHEYISINSDYRS